MRCIAVVQQYFDMYLAGVESETVRIFCIFLEKLQIP